MNVQNLSKGPLASSPVSQRHVGAVTVGRFVRNVVKIVFVVWPARSRQRFALAELEDFRLEDIGISREEARRECGKGFWR
jgi:uncharacterized protein YjiS (DUF1127 family)